MATLQETQASASQPLATAGVIASAALPVVGDLVNYGLQKRENRLAYERNLEMWNKQNLYNHPSQQMERLKAAGLNPNLVYGNGTSTVAGPGPTMQPATPNIKTGLDPLGKLGQFQNLQLTKAQTDNVQAETANKVTENTNKILQQEILKKEAQRMGIDIEFMQAVNPDRALLIKQEILNKTVDTAVKTQDLTQKKAIQPYQVTSAREQAKQAEQATLTQAREYNILGQNLQIGKEKINQEKLNTFIRTLDISGKRSENELKEQQVIFEKWKNKLTENGITTSDNVVVRALLAIQKKYNLTFEQMFPNIDEIIKMINEQHTK
ncbi:MAG: DNA pilot protein [Microviridae sp.]|nr:MAG: DNA pilot protein [Microviridae sp.]